MSGALMGAALGSTSVHKSYYSKRGGDTPLSGPVQGCAVEQGMVWEVLTLKDLKQVEELKVGCVAQTILLEMCQMVKKNPPQNERNNGH